MKQKMDLRYIDTYLKWRWYNASEGFIHKNTTLLFIIVGLIAVSCYYLPLPGNQSGILVSISNYIAKWLGITYVNDGIVTKLITTVIGSMTIVISLLSAIYVFTHREQKSVSPSASTDNHKNMLVTFVICLMLFNMIFGYLIINEYDRCLNEKGYVSSLIITKNLYSKITFLFFTLFVLICLIISLIKYLYRTMSADKMLVDSIEQTSKSFEDVLHTYRAEKFSDFLDERYRRLHFNFESVFQNLKFAADHNMNKEFEENINRFKKLVIDKMNEKSVYWDDTTDVHYYLLYKDDKKFMDLYNSALRSNLALISTLLKNQRYNKAKEVVSLYFYMNIHDNHILRKVFQVSVNDFLDFIDTSDERQLLILLDGMSGIPRQEALRIYKFLLMKMVNRNQLKNLTNVVYSFKNENEKENFTKNSIIVILLQNLIKSIEISNYQISGFLVKFLVTNFLGADLNKGLMILKKKRDAFTSVLEEGEVIVGVTENEGSAIKINDETFDYCYKKALILLYGQHVYSIRQKMWYSVDREEIGKEIMIGREFKNCDYSEYIMNKTKAAASKYGLLFFEDKILMKQIYNELNLSHLIPKEVKTKSFPETFSLLIGKFLKI